MGGRGGSAGGGGGPGKPKSPPPVEALMAKKPKSSPPKDSFQLIGEVLETLETKKDEFGGQMSRGDTISFFSLYHAMQKTQPDLTKEKFHKLMTEIRNTGMRIAKRQVFMSGAGNLTTVKRPDLALPIGDGRHVYYIRLGR